MPPSHLHDALTEDYRDMIYADTPIEAEKRRKAFLRKWRLKARAVVDSLEEAGDRLFTFTRRGPAQWKAATTTNAIVRLNEEFRRSIKSQTVLPCAETVPMLLWALWPPARSPCASSTAAGPSTNRSSPCRLTSPLDQAHSNPLGGRCRKISTPFEIHPKDWDVTLNSRR